MGWIMSCRIYGGFCDKIYSAFKTRTFPWGHIINIRFIIDRKGRRF